MLPVLFNIGSLSISSFGFFMALGFLAAIFILWRISQVYEIDPEKVLDLALLTFFGGLIGSRIYFILLNWPLFDGQIVKMILLNRYPGLSFWGATLGGFFSLWYLSKKMRLSFWQVADFAAVAYLIGIIIGDVGCFLGGCAVGSTSSLPIATPVVGLIGKRFPTPLFEAVLLFFVYSYLYKMVLRFHFPGKIVALFLIFLGVIKIYLEVLRGDRQILFANLSYGHVLATLSVILGMTIFYTQSDRNLIADIHGLISLPLDYKKRAQLIASLQKSCYNQKVGLKIKSQKSMQYMDAFLRKIKRRFNVRSTPQ